MCHHAAFGRPAAAERADRPEVGDPHIRPVAAGGTFAYAGLQRAVPGSQEGGEIFYSQDWHPFRRHFCGQA
jgi:hypothetical protein